jgi:hypothetical protein
MGNKIIDYHAIRSALARHNAPFGGGVAPIDSGAERSCSCLVLILRLVLNVLWKLIAEIVLAVLAGEG